MPSNAAANTLRRPNATPANDQKDQRISMRVSAAQRELLTEASRTEEITLTEFIIDAATTRAEDVLADRRHFVLDADAYRAFLQVLDRPVQDKPKLRRLLIEPSVFED